MQCVDFGTKKLNESHPEDRGPHIMPKLPQAEDAVKKAQDAVRACAARHCSP